VEPARIDLNFGTQEQLESLPGIGPALAKAIIEARPFATAEELTRVRGVGLKLLEKLRPLIQAAPGRRTADTR
jgi:competence protein ComEA